MSQTIQFKDLEIMTCTKGSLSPELLALRKKVYCDELAYLSEQTLANSWDQLGVHIYLTLKSTGQAIVCGHVYQADQGEWAEHSGLGQEDLQQGAVFTRVMVDPEYRGQGLSRVVFYLMAQKARMWNLQRVFGYAEPGDTATRTIWEYEQIIGCKDRIVQNPKTKKEHRFIPITQRLDLLLMNCFTGMSQPQKEFCQPSIVDEIMLTTQARIERFFAGPFFQTLYAGEFKRQQYLKTLAGFHQFVRYTTRILGRAVSLSTPSDLRRHFINHLGGEVDHEVQLENDIRALKGDVDYVRDTMIPSSPALRFMVIQESYLAFRHDPVAFIGVPFAIEGFTAHLDPKFMPCLEKAIESWGYNAKRATTFLRLHLDSDGGEDGHWEGNRKILEKYIQTEPRLATLLNVIHLTFDSMEELYSSFVTEKGFDVQPYTPSKENKRKAA